MVAGPGGRGGDGIGINGGTGGKGGAGGTINIDSQGGQSYTSVVHRSIRMTQIRGQYSFSDREYST